MGLSQISRVWLVLVACVMALFSATLLAQGAPGGKKYVELSPVQPTEPGKVEVLEFFAYSCPHCAALEPLLEKWIKSLPPDVVVRRVPVAFNGSMRPLQQLYYSLEAMDRMDLNAKAFKAIHEEKKRVFTKPDIIAWVAEQGVDRAKFEAMFDSFGVTSKVGRADQLVNAYKIEGTPSIAVAGRYVVSPSETGGYQQTIDQADVLVRQVRAAK